MKNQITERALACLNATNEAIIRSDYRDEALQGVSRRRGAGQFVRRAIEKRFFMSDLDVTPLSLAPRVASFEWRYHGARFADGGFAELSATLRHSRH
jgi:hypothetical protein